MVESISLSIIQKVLQKKQVKPMRKIRRHKEVKRYQCSIPGEPVQMDTGKIGNGALSFARSGPVHHISTEKWNVLKKPA